VESAVIRVTPNTRRGVTDREGFLAFVSACFRQKRKTLRNNLAGLCPREILSADTRFGRRAEELTVDEFIHLFAAGS
jgi:16S rRNA (adenine1518-N6/adenine1519-N6)-dimethyltransferase